MAQDQLDIFNISEPAARNSDPWTSHAAAEAFPSGRKTDRLRVLLTHAANPAGLTDFELASLVGRQQTSAGKRRGELMAQGYILPTEGHRPAPSGSAAIVWRITETGLALARLIARR
jgi:hypothetical protein